MSYSIRRLRREDAPIFRQLRLNALTKHPDAFGGSAGEYAAKSLADVEKWLSDLVTFGAFSGDELVAIGAYFREKGEKTKHSASVVSIYTSPKARGRGLSGKILDQLAQTAMDAGIIQLYLGVNATNEAAKKSYVRAGFETYGIEPRSLFVDGKYIDEELMVRFLDKAPKGKIK
ncbi:N-acetyltransferase family protein [Maritalea sp.]|uniref:GNAT family N-acetyltransferase n=1 Tax=Maritalea sp. TaxID=2003361 RepID=UPI003EFAB63E